MEAFPATLKDMLSSASRSKDTVLDDLPGSLMVYDPPFIGPPILLIVNVADKSRLQATPNPRYGSGCEGVLVGAGVAVLLGV